MGGEGTDNGDIVEQFERDGLVTLPTRLPAPLVDALCEAALKALDSTLARVRAIRRQGLGVGMGEGYAEIVQRAPGRFDLTAGIDRPPFTDPALHDGAPWRSVVEHLLGGEARRLYCGVLVAAAGAAEQPWHADGEHLFFPAAGQPLPAHCVNIFVPLVDLTGTNGATEFCPGSQRLGGDDPSLFAQDPNLLERIGYRGKPRAPLLPAGSVLLFDYRLVHRGLPNRSTAPRPLLYMTYARPWFRDARSFPERVLGREGLG